MVSSLLTGVGAKQPMLETTADAKTKSGEREVSFGDGGSSDEADSDKEGLDPMTRELMAPLLS